MNAQTRLLLKSLVVVMGLLLGTTILRAAEPDGGAVFKQRCAMCHGADGKGFSAIKTPNMTDPKWQESKKDTELIEVIKDGKKGTPMPPFGEKLKDDEIKAVVTFIRSLDTSKKK